MKIDRGDFIWRVVGSSGAALLGTVADIRHFIVVRMENRSVERFLRWLLRPARQSFTLPDLNNKNVMAMASILVATAFTYACGGGGSSRSKRAFDITGKWEIVLKDGRVSQSIKGTLVEKAPTADPPWTGVFAPDTVSDRLLNAYGPGSGPCPQGWPTSPPGNTRLDGTIGVVACFLCDSPQYPVDFHLIETDPAQGGLKVADVELTGVYYANIIEMGGSWHGTMIACTGMDSSGSWEANSQP